MQAHGGRDAPGRRRGGRRLRRPWHGATDARERGCRGRGGPLHRDRRGSGRRRGAGSSDDGCRRTGRHRGSCRGTRPHRRRREARSRHRPRRTHQRGDRQGPRHRRHVGRRQRDVSGAEGHGGRPQHGRQGTRRSRGGPGGRNGGGGGGRSWGWGGGGPGGRSGRARERGPGSVPGRALGCVPGRVVGCVPGLGRPLHRQRTARAAGAGAGYGCVVPGGLNRSPLHGTRAVPGHGTGTGQGGRRWVRRTGSDFGRTCSNVRLPDGGGGTGSAEIAEGSGPGARRRTGRRCTLHAGGPAGGRGTRPLAHRGGGPGGGRLTADRPARRRAQHRPDDRTGLGRTGCGCTCPGGGGRACGRRRCGRRCPARRRCHTVPVGGRRRTPRRHSAPGRARGRDCGCCRTLRRRPPERAVRATAKLLRRGPRCPWGRGNDRP